MLFWRDTLFVVAAALAFDALIGDPEWMWRRLAHPVVVMGELIHWLDRNLNRQDQAPEQRKLAGVVAVILLVGATAIVGIFLDTMLRLVTGGTLLCGLIASVFVAQRSLYEHVDRVRAAFADGGLASARRAVAMIVG